MSKFLKLSIGSTAAIFCFGCGNVDSQNQIERIAVGMEDTLVHSADRSWSLSIDSNSDLKIYRNGKSVFELVDAVNAPSIINIIREGEIVVIENGFGSGQISKSSIYVDGILKKNLLTPYIDKFLSEYNCDLNQNFVNEQLSEIEGSELIFSFSVIDRFGVCKDLEKKIVRVAVRLR